jgi:putative tryptophan/tyrosine transport system substrate-binding protein
MLKFIAFLFVVISIASCKPSQSGGTTIGIVVPLEHKAMVEIVSGFTETLKKIYPYPVTIKVENAQNDPNLQRAIIQKIVDADDALIVPIGASSTQMTLSMAHGKRVVSLASDLSDADRKKQKSCQTAIVHDEISTQQILEFIHLVYPSLHNLTLIHSSADKIFPDVKKIIEESQQYGITVKDIMVSSLPELYAAIQAMPAESQAILILKDNLIVSGISTLAKVAADRHIPLITSDQGSVQEGAGLALGVHEREIGVQGAMLAAAALQGKSLCEMPIVEMKNLSVFINEKSLQQEAQDLQPILNAAKQLHYQTENVAVSKSS